MKWQWVWIAVLMALWASSAPLDARSFDSSDFPIRVYVSPYLQGTEKTDKPIPIEEDKLRALRRGILDWNELLLAMPKTPNNQTYAIVLYRQDGEKNVETLNGFGFLVLVDRPEQADLVVEATEKYNLQGEDSRYEKATIGSFSSDGGYRIGHIRMSLLRYSSSHSLVPVDQFDLRTTLIHEVGHALNLDHVEGQDCNVMSPVGYTCIADYPAQCQRQEGPTLCIGIQDSQLRQVEAQRVAVAGSAPRSERTAAGQPEATVAAELFNRALARSEKADYVGALEDYTQALKADPKLAAVYINRAYVYSKLDKLPEAIAEYDQYLRLKPDDADPYRYRGECYLRLNQYDRALADFERVIALKPEDARAFYDRGYARDRSGNPKGAIEDYSKAISLKADFADAYYSRGNLRLNAEDYRGVVEDLSHYLESKPEKAGAYFARSHAYVHLKDYAAALKDLDRGLVLQPDDARAYRLRGQVHYRLKDLSGARVDWQKAAELYRQKGEVGAYKQTRQMLEGLTER